MIPLLRALLLAVSLSALCGAAELETVVRVWPGEPVNRVTRLMTGACIEDVNHEIYGGIYCQMVFGESFQEPAFLPGFTSYGGSWVVEGDMLRGEGGDGPKLVVDDVTVDQRVGVEVLLPGRGGGNAGLIVSVSEPAVGADAFRGYEISLDAERRVLVVGRHEHNWTHIADVPIEIEMGAWIALDVKLAAGEIEVRLNGAEVFRHRDEQLLPVGGVGLRTWQRDATFRNLWVESEGGRQEILFAGRPEWASGVSGMWRPFRHGDVAGSFSVNSGEPFVGVQSQRLTFDSGVGSWGVENRGLNRQGMCFVAGKPYEGILWARAEKPVTFDVALESAEGNSSYARQWVTLQPGEWRRLTFTLTPDASDTRGRLAISLTEPGSVSLGYASLHPGAWGRYKGLPVRGDVAQAMVDQGLTVLRLGGLMANAPEYRWKKMLGPADRRQPYRGFWYPHTTNGWGIIEFLTFCEAAGFEPVADFNMDETPADMADFVEYANGPAESEWGRRRSDDGHPAPYRLKYIQLGNEEAVDEAYWTKFKPLAEAIWATDPDVVIIVGDFEYKKPIVDPLDFEGGSRISSLAAHKKILDLAKAHGRPVWFDVHIWNDGPEDILAPLAALPTFIAALEQLSPGAEFKICVLEENAINHSMRRALSHALTINALMRLGDRVQITCAANALQVDGQNDNGWDQGLVFMNPCHVWRQPPSYVTQMMSNGYQPNRVRTKIDGAAEGLDVLALASDDGGELTLAVVNAAEDTRRGRLELAGGDAAWSLAEVTQLKAPVAAVNDAREPERVALHDARDSVVLVGGESTSLWANFPPRSVTTIKIAAP